jgi:type I restriction enzyme M protein
MQWIAPSEKDSVNHTLEKRLWESADQLRANSGLTAAQYSTPVLGLIFLRFAETRFAKRRAQLEKSAISSRRSSSRTNDPSAYHADQSQWFVDPDRGGSTLTRDPTSFIEQSAADEVIGQPQQLLSRLLDRLASAFGMWRISS